MKTARIRINEYRERRATGRGASGRTSTMMLFTGERGRCGSQAKNAAPQPESRRVCVYAFFCFEGQHPSPREATSHTPRPLENLHESGEEPATRAIECAKKWEPRWSSFEATPSPTNNLLAPRQSGLQTCLSASYSDASSSGGMPPPPPPRSRNRSPCPPSIPRPRVTCPRRARGQ